MEHEIIIVTIYQPKRIPNSYRPPLGLPLNWKDEISGELPRAVFKYFAGESLSSEEISLLAEYCLHHINAPCWDGSGGLAKELAALRESAASIRTVQDISRWINDCLEIAIDPF